MRTRTVPSATMVLLALAGIVSAAPVTKTGPCPTLTRSIAPPTANGGWSQFPIKPGTAFVTGCTSTAQDNCTQQDPLPPAQSINCTQVPEGMKIELWASEEIKGTGADTGTIAYVQHFTFDERGRVWAVEPRSYPNILRAPGNTTGDTTNNNKLRGGNDRILILEDANGDGVMDKFKVFLDGINVPGGIEVVNGGVIVVMTPYIIFYPNVNDTAGPAQILWHNVGGGTGNFDTHFSSGYPFYHLENFIFAVTGNNACTARVPGVTTGGVECGARRTWRFKHAAMGSDTTLFQTWAQGTGSSNSRAVAQMEDGQIFQNTATAANSITAQHGVRATSTAVSLPTAVTGETATNRYYPITRDSYLWEGSTSEMSNGFPSGQATATNSYQIYTSRLFPQKYWNRFGFTCDGSYHLCNQDSMVVRMNGEHSTSTWNAMRMPGQVRSNIFASTDAWTAPLQTRTGPDGALWVLDWYNYLFLHNPASPNGSGSAWDNPVARAKTRNRIYRIAPLSGQLEPVLNLSTASVNDLVATLYNPNMLWRLHAQRLLIGRTYNTTERAALLNSLETILNRRSVDAVELDAPVIHALWTLEGLGEFKNNPTRWNPKLRALLLHPAWTVRRNVLRAMPRTAATATAIRDQGRVNDPHGHVRLQAFIALSEISNDSLAGGAAFKSAIMIFAPYRTVDVSSGSHASTMATAAGITDTADLPAIPPLDAVVAIRSVQDWKLGTQARNDLRFDLVPNGFNLLPNGRLASGELVVSDLRGKVAFRSTYNAPTGTWSQKSARNLGHSVYFYSFRENGGTSFNGRISLLSSL
jgi:uncharacterized protein